MKLKIWYAIRDGGDGEHSVVFYPTLEKLRADLQLDDDDFEPNWDIPVEIDCNTIESEEYGVVE